MSYYRINLDQTTRTYNVQEGKKPLFVKSSHYKQCKKLEQALNSEKKYTTANPELVKNYLEQLKNKYSSESSNNILSRLKKTLNIKSKGDKIADLCETLLKNYQEKPPKDIATRWGPSSYPHKSLTPAPRQTSPQPKEPSSLPQHKESSSLPQHKESSSLPQHTESSSLPQHTESSSTSDQRPVVQEDTSQLDAIFAYSSEDIDKEKKHDQDVYEQYSYLEGLPPEIQLEIFKKLSGQDLASLARVSKSLRNVVDGFPELTEKVRVAEKEASVSFQNNKMLLEHHFIDNKIMGGNITESARVGIIFDNKTGKVVASEKYGGEWMVYPDCPLNLANSIQDKSFHIVQLRQSNDFSVLYFDFRIKKWNATPELPFVQSNDEYLTITANPPALVQKTASKMMKSLEAAYEKAWQDFTSKMSLQREYTLNDITGKGVGSQFLFSLLKDHLGPYNTEEIAKLRADRIAKVKKAFPDSTKT